MFKQFFDPETSTLSYLLIDDSTQQALMIDPVLGQEETYLQVLSNLKASLSWVVETHVHADHITGARVLKDMTGCQFAAGAGTGVSCAERLLNDGDSVEFGREKLTAIATPGHTAGCTSYRWHDRLFTGDTLLINGCGRTDFQQGDAGQLYDSLQTLLASPDETLVYPAHDYNGCRVSSIGQEKLLNPRIKDQDRAGFIELMNGLKLAKPKKIDIAVPANIQCGIAANGDDTSSVAHSA